MYTRTCAGLRLSFDDVIICEEMSAHPNSAPISWVDEKAAPFTSGNLDSTAVNPCLFGHALRWLQTMETDIATLPLHGFEYV